MGAVSVVQKQEFMFVDPETVVDSPLATLVEIVPVSQVERVAKAGIAIRHNATIIMTVFIV